MHLDDLDVPGGIEGAGDGGDQPGQQVDAQAHIGAEDDGRTPGGLGEAGLPGGVDAGGADDMGLAARCGELGMGDAGGRLAEFDDGIAGGEQGLGILAQRHARRLEPGEPAEIGPDLRRAGALDAAGEAEAGRGRGQAQQHAPHPAGGAGDADAAIGHLCNPPTSAGASPPSPHLSPSGGEGEEGLPLARIAGEGGAHRASDGRVRAAPVGPK